MKLELVLFLATMIIFRTLATCYLDNITQLEYSLSESPNSEAKLARKLPISLEQADLFDIELISGIGDELGARILKLSQTIDYQDGICDLEKYLQGIKGIGPKRAKKLASKIILYESCGAINARQAPSGASPERNRYRYNQ